MKNVSFRRNGVEFEPTKQELKIVLDDFAKRIADLEKELQDWQDGTIIAQWQDCEQRVKELERQLAEKDKLINDYADEHGMLQCKIADLVVKEIKAEDFAIEQLEQMKEKLGVLLKNTEKELNSITDLEFHNKVQGSMKGYMDSINIIDQQIQELKGEENV